MRILLLVVIILIQFYFGYSENNCTTPGRRFSDDKVPDCKGFIICMVYDSYGSFTEINLTCPENFIFVPLKGYCSNSTNFNCSNDKVVFACTREGEFENIKSKDCSTFISCALTIDNRLSAKVFTCLDDRVYSPIKGECVNKSEFNCTRSEVVKSNEAVKRYNSLSVLVILNILIALVNK